MHWRSEVSAQHDCAATVAEKSLPYTSTIVLLVRKGNQKRAISPRLFRDPVKARHSPVSRQKTPGRRRGGGGAGNFLAALARAQTVSPAPRKPPPRTPMRRVGSTRLPILDTGGGRAAQTSFAQTRSGRCAEWPGRKKMRAWLARQQGISSPTPVRNRYPSVEAFPRANLAGSRVVDSVVDKRGGQPRDMAQGPLEFLYTQAGQGCRLAAQLTIRPNATRAVDAKYAEGYTALATPSRSEDFGGLGANAQAKILSPW